MAASKRQTTMAKLQREQAVRDKRLRKAERKVERKREAAELKAAIEQGLVDENGEIIRVEADPGTAGDAVAGPVA